MLDLLTSARRILRQYQELGSQALARLSDEQVNWRPHTDTNSVAHIVRHMQGNMRSRWTDFLTTDGEKPDRWPRGPVFDRRDKHDERLHGDR